MTNEKHELISKSHSKFTCRYIVSTNRTHRNLDCGFTDPKLSCVWPWARIMRDSDGILYRLLNSSLRVQPRKMIFKYIIYQK